MRLVTYQQSSSATSAGVLLGDVLADITPLLKLLPATAEANNWPSHFSCVDAVLLAGALDHVAAGVSALQTALISDTSRPLGQICRPANSVSLLPPILRPSKVIGVGMNYHSFVTQLGEAVPEHLSLFHKTAAALQGHRLPVIIPALTDQAVPEGELAIVIGRRAESVSATDALTHVAGYCCANDISARNLEFQTTQWTGGKMLPTFGPLGPSLVTPDEITDVNALDITTTLNGKPVQHANTSDMIFSVEELVSRISHLVTLDVGDVILTGTPTDLGALHDPVFLTDGDTISVEIQGIGRLENPVTATHLRQKSDVPAAAAHLN